MKSLKILNDNMLEEVVGGEIGEDLLLLNPIVVVDPGKIIQPTEKEIVTTPVKK